MPNEIRLKVNSYEYTPPKPKIRAVMSVPRLGFNATWGCIASVLAELEIPIRIYEGSVFWGQTMQRAFREAVADGFDWILTIDYDSVFTRDNLQRLLARIKENPQIDALAPLQVKRESTDPLYRTDLAGATGLTKAQTAHFGLTLIKVSALSDISLPWFQSITGPDGEHENGVDEDIYFWNRWAESGKSLYVDTEVSIGHLQLMVSMFDFFGNVVHRTVSDWKMLDSD